MKITYDATRNVAYIRLSDQPAECETIELGHGISLDVAPTGSILGIELLNAQCAHWTGEVLAIENQETGRRTEVILP